MAGRRRTWPDGRADVLLAALDEYGLSASVVPRTAAVPVPVLGRCIAGLPGAIVLRLAERDDLDRVRTTTAQLAQALSALGQVIAGRHSSSDTVTAIAGPVVLFPPALLNRVPAISTPRGAGANRSSLAGRVRSRPRNSACRYLPGRRHGRALLQ